MTLGLRLLGMMILNGWRRGNGFEPPSRAVHTRALPIELPCQGRSRLDLRLGCFAIRRSARTHYRGHLRNLGGAAPFFQPSVSTLCAERQEGTSYTQLLGFPHDTSPFNNNNAESLTTFAKDGGGVRLET